MSETKIYLELSDEIQQAITQNKINIGDILDRQGIETKISHEALSYGAEDGARSKELVTVIIASGASIFAIGLAISQILKTIYRRPHFVEYYELVEIRDQNDRLLLDKWDNPQFKLAKKVELIEPREEDADRIMELGLNKQNGLVLKFGSSEIQRSDSVKNSK